MAEDTDLRQPEGEAAEPQPAPKKGRDWGHYWHTRLIGGFVGLLALLALGAVLLDSPIGHRFIANSLSSYAPASGLRIKVGRIEGSILSEATLTDVVLSDPEGVFLRIPEAELDWSPFRWFTTGLEVNRLIARRGHLLRMPRLRPGDPDAPLIPDFDIRLDRIEITDLLVDEAVAGFSRRVNLFASVDLSAGRAKIDLRGELGGEDRLFVRLDASQARDVLNLSAQYSAPAGGLLAGMTGAEEDMQILLDGDGKWTDWTGNARVRQGETDLFAGRLSKQGETYGVLGTMRPEGYLTGLPARLAGEVVRLRGNATFKDSVLDGRYVVVGRGGMAVAKGAVDLNDNEFSDFAIAAKITQPSRLGRDMRGEGVTLNVGLDGNYRRDLAVALELSADRFASGTVSVSGLQASGTGNWNGSRLLLPVTATARAIESGNALIDPRLTGAKLAATVTFSGDRLVAPDIVFDASGMGARLAMDGNVRSGFYRFAGPVIANGVALENLGIANARANIDATLGGVTGWTLSADVDGRMTQVTNATVAEQIGAPIAFTADVTLARNAPILIKRGTIDAPKLDLSVSGRRSVDGTVTLAGEGTHTQYGPFVVDTTIDGAGPRAELVFADPLPAAGLKDVRLSIVPSEDGFAIETNGESMLGPFTGDLELVSPAGGPTRITVNRFTVSETDVTGELTAGEGGLTGDLALSGGGVEGTIALAPNAEGQGIDSDIILRDARFAGSPPIRVRLAHFTARGTLGDAPTLDLAVNAQGISRGELFIGRFAAEGKMNDGTGTFRAHLAGQRGSRFRMRMAGEITGERIEVAARGRYAGRDISMPRAVVLLRDDNGWTLQRSQLDFAGGIIQAEGRFGTTTDAIVRVNDMPLDVANLFIDDLGLGGEVSGVIEYRDTPGSLPTGKARLLFADLTRSGLVLTSRPVDLAMVAELTAGDFELRSIIRDDTNRTGRLQARIANLPPEGSLVERLNAGSLFAQLRYGGPADALWRLLAIETFDLTGKVDIAGDIRGTLSQPQIRGTLRADDMRLQSTLTGTNVTGIRARGSFDGAVLQLNRFTGVVGDDGTVAGSGSVDLSNLTDGVGLDIRIAANNARLLNRDDMAATVTGPIRVVAANNVGTIAARLDMVKGRWRLGSATEVLDLPNLNRTEINLPADRKERTRARLPWNYLIDVSANNRLTVTGMGLDSEWGVDVRLRGNTDAPILYGRAGLVRGGYEFAGKRFELTKGDIRFSGENPPDPRLDVEAQADVDDINATINIDGTAYAPEITFSSIPALPEEEVLSRLLFGDSVANISAPEALQLGAALASMRSGGGGMDPINRLRGAIGLDRLRVVGADEALGRGTSVAIGQYLGRDLYVELVTDGKGYNATELEYRVTSWLSLLGTISSLGYNTVEAEISRDY